MAFTHLHLHTMYSLLDGAIRMRDLVGAVKSKGMNAVAVTDHGNMFGAVDFYKKAKEANIKPIFGMEAYVAGAKGRKDRSERSSNHFILLARNAKGYANLRKLSSAAYREGFYFHPRIDKPLLREHSEGLIGLSACLGGDLTQACRSGDMDSARRLAKDYADIFEAGQFFLEIQWNGLPEQEAANANLKELAKTLHLPLAATADAHYLRREEAAAHELLMCIASGKTLNDENRMRYGTDKLFVCTAEEMRSYFPDVPEAVDNTMRISESVETFSILADRPVFPTFKVPEGHTPQGYLDQLARAGLIRRFGELSYPVDQEAYRARLEHELQVVHRMGFSGYFLVVQDFINWSKSQGIPVGPGRGSGAGSLVAFSLRITDLDPIPFNLLFERFMNPERVSMPDFDVDFCQDRRDEVIRYVQDKYGHNNVGQIITFGQLRAKSVIRDVCRVYGLPYSEGDRIAKLVPDVLNISLRQAIYGDAEKGFVGEPQLKEMVERPKTLTATGGRSITTKEVLEVSLALEGLNRHAGIHAAGIVIADRPLEEYVPVYQPPGETTLVTQFAKDEVEAVGLVKFDFLGLKTLTVIEAAIVAVNRTRGSATPLAREKIPLDDPKTYELMCSGDTAGVFQMESSGFTTMLRQMKPSCFEDVIAAGALFRPGPLNQKFDDGRTMVDIYIDRKRGREQLAYPHPSLEPVLRETYGVIVYQEQVMQIAQVLSGYSLGGADILRRAMGKKKVEEMANQRSRFTEGAVAKGVRHEVADQVFTLMETFAGYGFNKSHSAAYGLISVHTAYLKAHHPVEFMAALLTSERENTNKVVEYISVARSRGIEVLPPNVNDSERNFSVVEGKIRFGLGAIKGVGTAAIDAILEARAAGPFKSLFDFCDRIDAKRLNRKVVEVLVQAGGFDFEGRHRAQVFAAIERALAHGATTQRDRELGQGDLFAAVGADAGPQVQYPEVAPWPERTLLQFEKDAIGYFVSGHPLDQFARDLKWLARPISTLSSSRSDEDVKVAGVVARMREFPTKTGRKMARVTLEDLTGSVDMVCFPRRDKTKGGYEAWESILKSDEPILVGGVVQYGRDTQADGQTIEIKVESIESLRSLRESRKHRLELRFASQGLSKSALAQFAEIAKRHAGSTPVGFTVRLPTGGYAQIGDTSFTVKLSDEFVESVDGLFGAGTVVI